MAKKSNSSNITKQIERQFEKLNESSKKAIIDAENFFKNKTQPISPLVSPQEKTNQILTQIVKQNNVGLGKYHFDKKAKKFSALLIVPLVIDFNSKRGNHQMADLFEILWDYLEENGKIEGDYKKIIISRNEIILCLKNKGIEVDEKWIKNVKNNLISTKFTDGLFTLSDYDPLTR